MVLFHGSNCRDITKFRIIQRETMIPELGDGVYFTSDYNRAKTWACKKSLIGAVYRVDVDLTKLNGIFADRNNSDLFYYVAYLYRINLRDIANDCLDEIKSKDYIYGEVIKSPRKFVESAEAFNSGEIEICEFMHKTKTFGKRFEQYCFRSERAINAVNSGITGKIYVKKTTSGVLEEGDWINE